MKVVVGRASTCALRHLTKRLAPPSRPTPYWFGPAPLLSSSFLALHSALRPRRLKLEAISKGRTSFSPFSRATSSPTLRAFKTSSGSSAKATLVTRLTRWLMVSWCSAQSARCSSRDPNNYGLESLGGFRK